jgi:CubicO group peptidase (beta-lactamase class C family)
MCATARDIARIGHLVAEGGRRGGTQVIPSGWIEDIAANGDAGAWQAGSLTEVFPGLAMRYRSKWYVVGGEVPLLSCWGIHGQHLLVDRRHGLVVAKFSSQAQPIDAGAIVRTIDTVSTIRSALIGGKDRKAR